MLNLSGKKALITGATGGIGKSIAKVLLAQGAEVILSATKEEKLQELVIELSAQTTSKINYFTCLWLRAKNFRNTIADQSRF